jgi:pimeloyl-ACP methyl ester carboxylesterase
MNFVYLHGFCSGPNTFKGNYFRDRFAARGLVLHTPDLNGGDFEHLSLSGQLAAVRELLAELDGDVRVIGSSMGGYLAVLLAQEDARIRDMVLMAPAFRFVERILNSMTPDQGRAWRDDGYITVYHYQYQEDRRLHYGIVEDAAQYDQRTLNRAVPALIFHGINDETVPYGLSIEYLRANPQAQLSLLPSEHTLGDQVDPMWDAMRARWGLS